MVNAWSNLVFKGGGIKGLAYIGALKALDRRGILNSIRRVAGASSGAMCATFLALGATPSEMSDIVSRTRFQRFLDSSVWMGSNIQRLLKEFGWFKGDALSRWIYFTIASLTGDGGITFGQVEALRDAHPDNYRELSIVAANYSTQAPVVFNAGNTPNVPISEALRIAMSIPLFFKAVRSKSGDLLGDGGLLWNYPISIYDHASYLEKADDLDMPCDSGRMFNSETLGLMVETRSPIQEWQIQGHERIDDFAEYLRAMLGLMTDTSQSGYLSVSDWNRTIFIEALGVRATDFKISPEIVGMLMESGEKSVESFFVSGKGGPPCPCQAGSA